MGWWIDKALVEGRQRTKGMNAQEYVEEPVFHKWVS